MVVSMDLLNRRTQKEDFRSIHSPLHLFIKETMEMFGDNAKRGVGSFPFYLGLTRGVSLDELFRIRATVMQSSNTRSPNRLFVYLLKNARK